MGPATGGGRAEGRLVCTLRDTEEVTVVGHQSRGIAQVPRAPERLAKGPITASRRRLPSRSGSSGAALAALAPRSAAPSAVAPAAPTVDLPEAPWPGAAAGPAGMFLSRTMLLAAASRARARCSGLPTTLGGMRRKGLSSSGPSKWPSVALQGGRRPARAGGRVGRCVRSPGVPTAAHLPTQQVQPRPRNFPPSWRQQLSGHSGGRSPPRAPTWPAARGAARRRCAPGPPAPTPGPPCSDDSDSSNSSRVCQAC